MYIWSQDRRPEPNTLFKGLRFLCWTPVFVNWVTCILQVFSKETAICFYDVSLPSTPRLVDWSMKGLMDHTRLVSHISGNWEDNIDTWEKYKNILLKVILYFGFISPIISYANHLPRKSGVSAAMKYCALTILKFRTSKMRRMKSHDTCFKSFPV